MIRILLILMIITTSAYSQNFNQFKTADAAMLQVNGNTITERELEGIKLSLTNSSQLNVKFAIPYFLIDYPPLDHPAVSSAGLIFNLKMNIAPWDMQEYLTSAKSFSTHAYLTMNDSTKPVKVEYMPLPAGPDNEGDFKLSMIIEFNPDDFNLKEQNKNSQFIIKISNAIVSRL